MYDNLDFKKYMPNVLKYYRKRARMTQLQVADFLQVEKCYISAFENGRALPNIKIIFKMAVIFNVKPESIIKKLREEVEENNNKLSMKQ